MKKNNNVNEDVYDGIWTEYGRNTNFGYLIKEFKNNKTGWTFEEKKYDKEYGPFCDCLYVYYTKDKNGYYTVPRLLIRIKDGYIFEIRTTQNQSINVVNLDHILEHQINKIPYRRKNDHIYMILKLLTDIQKKQSNNHAVHLNNLEIEFLINDDLKIESYCDIFNKLIKECRGYITIDNLNNYFSYIKEDYFLNYNLDWLEFTDDIKLPNNYKGYVFFKDKVVLYEENTYKEESKTKKKKL